MTDEGKAFLKITNCLRLTPRYAQIKCGSQGRHSGQQGCVSDQICRYTECLPRNLKAALRDLLENLIIGRWIG
jgi:hypothetical protein